MGFNIRGALQGGAYANFYMQKAKFDKRQEDIQAQRLERQEDMQRQKLAIDRFQAETTSKHRQAELDQRAKQLANQHTANMWQMDLTKAQNELDGVLEKQKTGRAIARDNEQIRHNKATEDIARGETNRKATATEKREKRYVRVEEIKKVQRTNKYPTTPQGLAARHSDETSRQFKILVGSRHNFSGVLTQEEQDDLLRQAKEAADVIVGPMVKAYNDLVDVQQRSITAGNLNQPVPQRIDIDTLSQNTQQQVMDPSSVTGSNIQGSSGADEAREILRELDSGGEETSRRFEQGLLAEEEVEAMRLLQPELYQGYMEHLDKLRGKNILTGATDYSKTVDKNKKRTTPAQTGVGSR